MSATPQLMPDDYAGFAGPVARALMGDPNAAYSSATELRYGTRGSLSIKLPTGQWFDHERGEGGGVLDLIVRQGEAQNHAQAVRWIEAQSFTAPQPASDMRQRPRIVKTYDYTDASGEIVFQVCRYEPKTFKQRQPDGAGGWSWSVKGVRQVPYRLPQMLAAPDALVFVVEGEKDADALAALGLTATCNAGGAGKWRDELSPHFAGRRVVILPDNDDAGRDHARLVAAKLHGVASSVRILELPGLPHKGDASDWLSAGGGGPALLQMAEAAPVAANDNAAPASPAAGDSVCLEDFHAHMPSHAYLFVPTRELWPAASVNGRIRTWPRNPATSKPMKPSDWLDQHRAVEQMAWNPAEPELIEGRVMQINGWAAHAGARVFNLYRAPAIISGDVRRAEKWREHLRTVYAAEADHIEQWLAQRVQRPGVKVNHALVLGGSQGTGKDTLLEPVRAGVGPWNWQDISPVQMLGRFNGWAKAVVVRVNEARDLGDVDRFAFYDHSKTYIAAPPDVIRVDEKNLREHYVANVMGVVITTNNRVDGLYLPADDRRHFVAWSELTRDAFSEGYWSDMWGWYERGGIGDVVTFLRTLDLARFDPKAPPPKTPAFWAIVQTNEAPESSELRDLLERAGDPDATTINDMVCRADAERMFDLASELRDRKNRRSVPHKFERVGYVAVRNPSAEDGLFKIAGKRQCVYAKKSLPLPQQVRAARELADRQAGQ